MGLLPLPEKLQFEVIPYVSPVLPTYLPPTYPNQSASSHSPYSNSSLIICFSLSFIKTAPLLGPHLLRRLSPGQTRLRSSHLQRRSASPRGVDGADSRGEERFEEQGCGCGLRCGFCGRERERESNTGLFTFFNWGGGSLMKVERKEVGTCGGGI